MNTYEIAIKFFVDVKVPEDKAASGLPEQHWAMEAATVGGFEISGDSLRNRVPVTLEGGRPSLRDPGVHGRSLGGGQHRRRNRVRGAWTGGDVPKGGRPGPQVRGGCRLQRGHARAPRGTRHEAQLRRLPRRSLARRGSRGRRARRPPAPVAKWRRTL